ncbi:MAG: hypothetical protein C4334_10165, partial [Pyrinomonas sp.]
MSEKARKRRSRYWRASRSPSVAAIGSLRADATWRAEIAPCRISGTTLKAEEDRIERNASQAPSLLVRVCAIGWFNRGFGSR